MYNFLKLILLLKQSLEFSTQTCRPPSVCKRRLAVQEAYNNPQEHQAGQEPLRKPGYQGEAGPVRHGEEAHGRGEGWGRREADCFPGNAQGQGIHLRIRHAFTHAWFV